MDLQEILPGLWRWTAPHPEWKPEKGVPGGWGEMVGCVYYEPPHGATAPSPLPGEPIVEDAVMLIDPLAPPPGTADSDRFWTALDRDVRKSELPLAILLGNEYHARSTQAVADRYAESPGVSIWGHESLRSTVTCRLTHTLPGARALPGGVTAHPIGSLSDGEVVYYLPCHVLVVADALTGVGDEQVRVAPPSWAPQTKEGLARYNTEFRASLRLLLALPFDRILVSHGPPVQREGRRALEQALEAPAWGA